MRRPDRERRRFRPSSETLEGRCTPAVTFAIDYSLDTLGFFADPIRRQVLQAAADDLGNMLGDSLAEVTPTGDDVWSIKFKHPATGVEYTIDNPSIPANTIVIYAGGRPTSDGEFGTGGPVGANASSRGTDWTTLVNTRGEAGAAYSVPNTFPTDFAPVAGVIQFDTTRTNWYFGTDPTAIPKDRPDFYSIATHDLAHVLGIGTSGSWEGHTGAVPLFSSRTPGPPLFTGPNAMAVYGGPVPLQVPERAHWVDETRFGGQITLFIPFVESGKRIYLTRLDLAALADIGWEVRPDLLSGATPLPGNPPGPSNPGPSVPAPAVTATSARTVTARGRIVGIEVKLTGSPDPASVGAVATYVIRSAGRDGKLGTADDRRVKVRAVAYDATTGVARLTLPKTGLTINKKNPADLTIVGLKGPSGQTVAAMIASWRRPGETPFATRP